VSPGASARTPLTIIISGPGGVGKSTIANRLVARDPRLWLSCSWTTRQRRDGESDSAYHFVGVEEFRRHIAAEGFLEWTEFLGNLYGTPLPEPVAGSDVVLEIEVDGAQQVKAQRPDAILIFVLPPTRTEQERRLRQRGDRADTVADRLRKAESEEPVGLELADHVLVNDNLDDTIDELLRIIDGARKRPR
jgi:guanylate kinase